MEEEKQGITIKKEEDMPEWYSQVVLKAGLADYAPIKGFMVIKPNGYAIWENIQSYFNLVLKKLNVKNAYFPLLIPESFFKKESEHAEGFAPELAWIERQDKEEERLAIRPTSETIMYDFYSRWIRSWRDLPLKINQWNNVLRWEVKQTKLFLRSREFLWQEGHCAYESEEECEKEALMVLEEYKKMCEELLAVPVITGKKTEKERFPGAKTTYAIEAFMPDSKSLQMGTSHNLGQGFSKGFNIKFLGKDEKEHIPWLSSWGVSTRLIGSVVMVHGDNKGLVLPPKLAPMQIVIIPIIFDKSRKEVLQKSNEIKDLLSKDFSVELDDREGYSPGWKFNEYELKGIPIRIEIGPRDIKDNQVIVVRRDNGIKKVVKINQLKEAIKALLETIQGSLLTKAKKYLMESIQEVSVWKDFQEAIKNKKLVLAPFCGAVKCEDSIKDETNGVSSRCIPFEQEHLKGKECIKCGTRAKYKVYFSRSY